jgi:hypothetical protein
MVGAVKHCPKCGSAMQFRLGELECAACGHVETAAPAPAEQEKPQDWGGVHRARLINAPPSAPPPLGDRQYFGASSWESAYGPEPQVAQGMDTLHREKVLYLTIMAGLYVLGSCASLFPGASGSSGAGPYSFFGSLFGAAFDLAIIWFVLFGDVSCLKWGCLVSTALEVVGGLVGLVIVIPLLSSGSLGTSPALGLTGALITFGSVAIVLVVGLRAWLAWILWRDLQSGGL